MSDQFVEQAKETQSALERLLLGLPGIRDYADKELRREADRGLRNQLAVLLTDQKAQLLHLQQLLLQHDHLAELEVVNRLVQRTQTLTDRLKSASAGYAGLFAAVKVQAEQLNALHHFDLGLAVQINALTEQIAAAIKSIGDDNQLAGALSTIEASLADVMTYFGRRQAAILSPDLLSEVNLPALNPTLDAQLAEHLK